MSDFGDLSAELSTAQPAPDFGNLSKELNPQVAASAPLRANNPGAMMPNGKMAQYPTLEAGLTGMDANLQKYAASGINTLAGVISKWAPPKDASGNVINDTASYIADASKRLGISPTQSIDLTNPVQRHAIGTAIMLHENGPQGVFGAVPAASVPAGPTGAGPGRGSINPPLVGQPQPATAPAAPVSRGGIPQADPGITVPASDHGAPVPPASTNWWDKIKGATEAVIGGTPMNITSKGAYSDPRLMSPTAQRYTGNISTATEPVTRNLPALIGLPAEMGALGQSAGPVIDQAGAQARNMVSAQTPVPTAATGIEPWTGAKPRYVMQNGHPVPAPTVEGPAAPVPFTPPTLADASPGLKAEVASLQAKGIPPDPAILARHVEADTLPVPVQLTAGQAAVNPGMISEEMNSRGKSAPPVPPSFYQDQGKALAANMDAVRASAAPDIPANASLVDHGQTLIDAYKQKAAAAQATVIAPAYQALADAKPGGVFLHGPDVKAAVTSALDTPESYQAPYLPPAIQSSIDKYAADGPMSLTRYEALRTQLSTAARSTAAKTDGNVMSAINTARSAVESLPMSDETAAIKPLADAARQAARTQFEAERADPAYSAAVNDTVPAGEPSPLADRFFQSYVTKGARANVATMAQNLSDNPLAKQTIAAGTIDQLKGQLKADPLTGNFSQDAFNKGLTAINPKLDSLLDPKTANTLQAVGNVAKYAQTQPRGSFVNNSNTATALAAEGAKQLATLGTNALFHGLPVGSAGRWVGGKLLDIRGQAQASANAIKPGAGLGISGSLGDVMRGRP